jgi:hypothetical protein
MMNIELGRIIQADKEREIQAELRLRRLTHAAEPTEAGRVHATRGRDRGIQRRASTGATSR